MGQQHPPPGAYGLRTSISSPALDGPPGDPGIWAEGSQWIQGAWLHRTWAGQALALAAEGDTSWHDIPGDFCVSDAAVLSTGLGHTLPWDITTQPYDRAQWVGKIPA